MAKPGRSWSPVAASALVWLLLPACASFETADDAADASVGADDAAAAEDVGDAALPAKGTEATVPSPPGLVRVMFVPWKSSGLSLFSRVLVIRSS